MSFSDRSVAHIQTCRLCREKLWESRSIGRDDARLKHISSDPGGDRSVEDSSGPLEGCAAFGSDSKDGCSGALAPWNTSGKDICVHHEAAQDLWNLRWDR